MIPFQREQLALYFIAGTQDMPCPMPQRRQALLDLLDTALAAGITCFQLRDKGAGSLNDPSALNALAADCLQRCRAYRVPLIIDDHLDLALHIGADGIHVGQKDTPIGDIIAQSHGRLIIGLTINNLTQAQEAGYIDGIDYFGVGPIYATTSKADAQPPVGTALLWRIRQEGIRKPIVAIGGINEHNANNVHDAGADGIAVISAITRSAEPAATIKHLLHTGKC